MTASLKTSLAVFVLSSALAGAAAPAFATNYYPGLDPHNRPDVQSQRQSLLPRLTSPPNVDVTPTGSIDGQRTYPTGALEQRYKGGDHDYYRGIFPPTP